MSMFIWKEEYTVGHAAIDTQHKRLFQLADDLHSAMAAGKGSAALSAILTNLVSYTKLHFADEERLMKECNYPEYLHHKKEHDELTAKVVAFQSDFAANRVAITVQLMHFLKDWLSHHIGENDKKIATYLRDQAA
jgi:hemerythrin